MSIYFPAFRGEAECHKCELEDCPNRGKYQRNNRGFSCISGRCPKLPNILGFVDASQRENQRKAYPFIHAEMDDEDVFLSISLPEKKKPLRLYQTRSGRFYFRTNKDGNPIKRIVSLGVYSTRKAILNFMEWHQCDYCIFACDVTPYLA